VNIAYPNGPEFDILALFTDGTGEPDAWWRSWFQAALDGIMKFTPPRTRKYFIRLVAFPWLPPGYPFAIEVMNTRWPGETDFQNALNVDPSLATARDLISANNVDREPPRTNVNLLRFAAALRHELVHVTKHRASHKTDLVATEREGHEKQQDFLLRAARHFRVSRKEALALVEENKQALRERLAGLQASP
jgi:hypothetical protein